MGRKKKKKPQTESFATGRSLSNASGVSTNTSGASSVLSTASSTNGSNGGSAGNSYEGQSFTPKNKHMMTTTKDRKRLLQYLKVYRDGVHDTFHGRRRQRSTGSNAIEPTTVIGGHTFPTLSPDVFRQPFLALPKNLASKQRKIIHEVCVEVGLFHVGVGETKADRYVVISWYADGIDQVPPDISIQNNDGIQHHHSLSKYKPWACQQGNHPEAALKRGREAIYQKIDQPGTCLRDDLDWIDFEKDQHLDLSDTSPPGFGTDDDWMLVDSEEKMTQCIHELQALKPTEIAFDLEAYNQSNHAQLTCLLQLAVTGGREYVIDPLAPGVWNQVTKLAPFFANPRIVKIGHSIGGLDVRCLHRDFGIFVVNSFDTYEAAKCLNLPSKGLAKVCAHYGLPNSEHYDELKAQYQTTDWTKRPLTQAMLQYGRYDVHYLIRLRKLMMRDLAGQELGHDFTPAERDVEAKAVATSLAAMFRGFDEDEETFDGAVGDGPGFGTGEDSSGYGDALEEEYADTGERQSFFPAKDLRMNLDVMQAISYSQDRCLDLWPGETVENPQKNGYFQSLLLRSTSGELDRPFTTSQIQLYEQLAKWRFTVAKKEGCTAGMVCTLTFLASVALTRPTTLRGLKQIQYHLPGALDSEEFQEELFDIVLRSRKEDGIGERDGIVLYEEFWSRERNVYYERRLNIMLIDSMGALLAVGAVAVVACFAAAGVGLVSRNRRTR